MENNYRKIFHQIICPDCNTGEIREVKEFGHLCCKQCKSEFPIIDGNPFLFRRNDLEEHISLNEELS